jgi:predicted dithiol-disulfide oxidoreductase (DUF899 family)
MTKHVRGIREEWLAARFELLEAESDLTRYSDELAHLARLDSLWGAYQSLERTLDGCDEAYG